MTISAAIGVDVGGTATKAAIVDIEGRILERQERPTDPSAGTKGIIGLVEDLISAAPSAGADVEAVGIGVAGFVDASEGSVTFSPNLTYEDPNIAAAVSDMIGMPVTVDNDANAAVWGERTFGTAAGFDHVALLTLGTGVGSGIVVDGRLLRGSTGAGAEFGHTVVEPDGPPCPCGLRGCLEQLASGGAIGRMGRAAAAKDPDSSMIAYAGSVEAITAEHVSRAARSYDEAAREVMRRAGTYLGIGLSNLANLFDPEVIVLAGSVVLAGEPYLGPARDRLSAMTAEQRRRPMRLDVTTLGGDAGILGAAAMARDPKRSWEGRHYD